MIPAIPARGDRIDVHHHFWSSGYLAALKRVNREQMLSQSWTVERSLADMDSGGVATAIVSVTTPGMSFVEGQAARSVARDSHAGGTMPFLVERFIRAPLVSPEVKPNLTNGVLPELKRFNYDIAQAAHAPALSALTRVVPVSQILFGTDYPYRTSVDHVNGVAQFGFSPADLRSIDRDNAVRLLPRWRA